MSGQGSAPKLSDADVKEILLAPCEITCAVLAGRFGVSEYLVWTNRRRRQKRAVRIAQELGLLAPPRLQGFRTLSAKGELA